MIKTYHTGKIMLELNKYQVFYGTLVRGPKAIVDKFTNEQLQNVYDIEKTDIGNGEVLLRTNCGGRQVECQTDDYKELAIAIFSSLGAQGSLFVKKSGETALEEYVLGEMDPDIENLQFYNVCPDKKIHEKYILCDYGEAVEFKYEPSEYVISMVSDNEINKNAKADPIVSFDCIEEYDEELDEAGYICIDII